jgi:hypothetical protein
MYESLTYTIKNDETISDVKWARFTWNSIVHEIRPILDSDGNVDSIKTLRECKDYLERDADPEETV